MAALAEEVTDLAEIEHLNQRILERYPEQVVFAPRETAAAVLRARPQLISVIDQAKEEPGEPELVEVAGKTAVRRR